MRKTNAAKDASVHSGWLLKRKKKKGKVSGWKKRFIDVRTDSITYAAQPGKAIMGSFDLFYCQVRPPEAQEKTPHFLLATGDALYDFAISTAGESLDMWTAAIEAQRTKLFTTPNENFKPAKKEPSNVMRAPVRKDPVEGEKLSGEVLVDVLNGADWPSRWFDVADGFMYVKLNESEPKALIRLRLERFVSLELVDGPPAMGKCIAMTIDGDDILFCPGTNFKYWVTGFSMLLRRYRPDAYARFEQANHPQPPPRAVAAPASSAAPPQIPFRVGEDVYAVFVDDGLWYKAVIDAIDGKVLRVTFTEYGNSQDCTVEMIRSLAEVAKMSAAAAVPAVPQPVVSVGTGAAATTTTTTTTPLAAPAKSIPLPEPEGEEDLPDDMPPPPLPAKPFKNDPAIQQAKKSPRTISETIHSDDVFMQFVEQKPEIKVLDLDDDEVDLQIEDVSSRPSLIDRLQMDQIQGGGKFDIDGVDQNELEEESRAAAEAQRLQQKEKEEEEEERRIKDKDQKRREKARLEAEKAELEAMNAELAALQAERMQLKMEEEEAMRLEAERARQEQEAVEAELRQLAEEERRRKEEEEELYLEEERRRKEEEQAEFDRLAAEEERLRREREEQDEERMRMEEEEERLRIIEEEERQRREEEEAEAEAEQARREEEQEAERQRLVAAEAERARQLKLEAEERARKLDQFKSDDDGGDDKEEEERLAAIAQAEAATREKLRMAKERAESIKSMGRGGPVKAPISLASSTGRGMAVPMLDAKPPAPGKKAIKWPPDPIPQDEPEPAPAVPAKGAPKMGTKGPIKTDAKKGAGSSAVVPPKKPQAETHGAKKVSESSGPIAPPKKPIASEPLPLPLERKKTESGLPQLPPKPDVVSPRKMSAPKAKALPVIESNDEEQPADTDFVAVVPPSKHVPIAVEEEPAIEGLPVPAKEEKSESDEELPPLPVPDDDVPPLPVPDEDDQTPRNVPVVENDSDSEEAQVVAPPPKKQLPMVFENVDDVPPLPVPDEDDQTPRNVPVVENDSDSEEAQVVAPPPKKQLPMVFENVDEFLEDANAEEEEPFVPPKKALPLVVDEEEEDFEPVILSKKQIPAVEKHVHEEDEQDFEPPIPPKKQLPPVEKSAIEEEEEEEGKKEKEDCSALPPPPPKKQLPEPVAPPKKELPRLSEEAVAARKKTDPPPIPSLPKPGSTSSPIKKPIPHAPSPVSLVSNLGSAPAGASTAGSPSRSTAVAAALERARLRKEQANK